MTITPTGAPVWQRTTDHTDYGGNVNKKNYMGQGVVNALTDVGAEDFVRICADLSALARTSPMWVITYLCNDTSPAAPTIEVVLGMTGVRVVSYAGNAAPTGFPSAARNGNGDVTFTFDSNYSDDYGVSAPWAPQTCTASVSGTAARCAVWAASGATLRVVCSMIQARPSATLG